LKGGEKCLGARVRSSGKVLMPFPNMIGREKGDQYVPGYRWETRREGFVEEGKKGKQGKVYQKRNFFGRSRAGNSKFLRGAAGTKKNGGGKESDVPWGGRAEGCGGKEVRPLRKRGQFIRNGGSRTK